MWSNHLLKWFWNLNFGPTLIIYSISIPQQSMYFTQKIDAERSFIKWASLVWAENRWTGQGDQTVPSSSPGSIHGGSDRAQGWAPGFCLGSRSWGGKGHGSLLHGTARRKSKPLDLSSLKTGEAFALQNENQEESSSVSSHTVQMLKLPLTGKSKTP